MNAHTRLLAHQVLNKKHLGMSKAMELVLGQESTDNEELHAVVIREIQDILKPSKQKTIH